MSKERKVDLISIIGHTAAGKTRIAALVASALGGEIISADSRQVYRGMSIGTGKDMEDYIVEGNRVAVHLIDIRDAGEEYNVYEFQKDFLTAYENIRARERIPVLCGGSGMYVEAVLRNYDLLQVPVNPELRKRLQKHNLSELSEMLSHYKTLHNKTDIDTKKRAVRAIEIAEFMKQSEGTEPALPEINSLNIGIAFDRGTRRGRITDRLNKRLETGLIEEVEILLKAGISHEKLEYYGLEYKYLSRYLSKQISYEEMYNKLNIAIHQFAKRQMTYFRGMERRGIEIHWVDMQLPMDKIVSEILSLYGTI